MTKYIELEYDPSGERYLRTDTGDEVRFTKALRLLIDEEEVEMPLSYTRAVDGAKTRNPVPCIRQADGRKVRLDGAWDKDEGFTTLAVADECLVAA